MNAHREGDVDEDEHLLGDTEPAGAAHDAGSGLRSVQEVSSTGHMWQALIAALGRATTVGTWSRHTLAASSRKALTD